MLVQHLARTRLQDVVGAWVGGQPVTEQHAVLRQLLQRELSERHAALLSEPVINAASGEVDWYAPGASPATRLDRLAPFDAAAVRTELGALLADCAVLAERLRASRNMSDTLLGTILAAALQVPGDASVHLLDGRPVLSDWGHANAGRAASAMALTAGRGGERMTVLPPPVAPRPARRSHLGVILAAALLLLVPLLVTVLLCWDPLRWLEAQAAPCRSVPGQAALIAVLRDEEARGTALRGKLARLLVDAGERRLQCLTRPAGRAAPLRSNPDTERARRAGGGTGKLQTTLAWSDVSNLDLHVLCAGGKRLSFNQRRVCNGMPNVDANADNSSITRTPVENAAWPRPRPGLYPVPVDPYDMRGKADALPLDHKARRAAEPNGERHAAQGQRLAPATQVEVEL